MSTQTTRYQQLSEGSKTPSRAVIFARKSTKPSADSTSLNEQTKVATTQAQNDGLEISEQITETGSAYNKSHRKEFSKMIEDMIECRQKKAT